MFQGKAYMTPLQYAYEEINKARTAAKFDLWLKQMFKKFRKAIEKEDYVELLRLSSAMKGMEYVIVSTEWAKKESLKETLAYFFKLPGLGKETRYVLYVLMSFSGGFTFDSTSGIPLFDADHPGDLERIIYEVVENKRLTVYYRNTISHGYADFRRRFLGVFNDVSEIIEASPIFLKPGDHAIKLLKEQSLVERIVSKIVPKYLGVIIGYGLTKEDLKEFPYRVLYDELEKIFQLDLYTFTKHIIELDKLIESAKRKFSPIRRYLLKNEQIKKLNYLQKVIWCTSAENLPFLLTKVKRLYNYEKLLGKEGIELIDRIIEECYEQVKKVWQLCDEALLRPFSFLEARGVKIELSYLGKMMIPIGLLTILRKPIYDWAYPEKMPLIKRIFARLLPGLELLFRITFHEAEMYYTLTKARKMLIKLLNKSDIKAIKTEELVRKIEQKYGSYRFFKRKIW